MTEIAKALDIDVRHLYIQATTEARALGERYVQCLHQRALKAQAVLHEELQRACQVLHDNGEGITVEQVAPLVGAGTLRSTHHLYTVLVSVRRTLIDTAPLGAVVFNQPFVAPNCEARVR